MDRRRVAASAALVGAGAYLLVEALSVLFVTGFSTVAPEKLALVGGASLAYLVGGGGVYFGFVEALDRPWNYAQLHVPDFEDVVWTVAGFVAMFGVMFAVSLVAQFVLDVEPAQHGLIQNVQDDPSYALYLLPLVALVVAPLEELVYRGLVQTRLREAFDVWSAVGLSSVLFALIHVAAYSTMSDSLLQTSVPLTLIFGVAVVMGGLYERTGNLFVPIALHSAFNGLQMIALYLDAVYDLGAT